MSTLDTVLHATLTRSRKKLMFAALRANTLFGWQMANKRIEFEDGGHEITNPLITGRNPNVGTTRYYDTMPIAQTDEFDTVKYGWARVFGNVIISGQEEDENRGEAVIFKLMNAKMQVLEESIKEKFSEYGHGIGAGTDPNGLGNTIPLDPTTGSLGDTDRATNIWWRPSSYDFAGTLDSTVIEEAFDDILMDLTQASDKPDVILVGRNIYRMYRAAVRSKVTIPIDAKGGGTYDLGFDGVKHGKTTILYDEDAPVNRAYFINSKYLRYHILRHVNMAVRKLTSPWNMEARGSRILWQGQLCLWNAYRKHAVMENSA
jgi:hypothetical protein